MRELQRQRKRRVGILCDLLMDVCLGVGVWPHLKIGVRFTYLISLLSSLSLEVVCVCAFESESLCDFIYVCVSMCLCVSKLV